jgi:methyl-accepting chemotaxis protein
MFNKFKLRTRILLGYVVPAAVYLTFAVMVYSTVNKGNETFKEVKRVQEVILMSDEMNSHVEKIIRNTRGYMINKSSEFRQEYQQSVSAFKTESQELASLITNNNQKEKIAKMIDLVDKYDKFSLELMNLMDQNKAAEAIALFKKGEGAEYVREFGKINKAFNQEEQELLLKQTAETESSLNYLTITVFGSFALIVITIVIAIAISNGISNTMNSAANAIAVSSQEINSTVESQEKIANSQASSVNETTTTMDELGNSSRTTAEQAEQAARGAKLALNLAASGMETVEKTMARMTNLQQKVGAIAEAIMLLSEQTMQISNISTLVGDLANQTNMLALNAAVEAVRAGEQGKGFSVVAAEIRKLADQSKKSAEKINTLIADIQKSINTTVMATEAGTQTAQDGVNIAQETARAFQGVTDSIDQIVVSNQQIALNAQQQALAIEQVVDAMNSINIGAKETANGIGQTKLGINKLNEAATNLKEVV